MSAQDMRDMLGLTGDVVRPPPSKKRKLVEKRPLEKGMAREVSALMGERAPPVSMIPVQPKYKQRPRRSHKAAPWNFAPFTNQARDDGLVLYHWIPKKAEKPAPVADVTEDAPPIEEKKEEPTNKEYKFAKYNARVEVPSYDDDFYNAQLKDEDWTKEETDYLVSIVKDYAQKWPVVVDRYEYQPSPSSDMDADSKPEAKSRSMEDLKARYYTVSARLLARQTPIASMDGKQYSLYQTLNSFKPVQETARKALVSAHLHRTQQEVNEETVLLSELQRIMINQQALESERKEIRDRLDYPIATSTTTQYNTSQALGQLFQQLLAADRLKKDRKLREVGVPSSTQNGAQRDHRDSITGNSSQAKRPPRDSLASAPDARALSPHSSQRFFVTVHDRINSGVGFASDKLSKPRIAKSTVQTERIASVLSYLKIPDIIPLPTQRVVEEFESLMSKVGTLLDMRKVAEKDEQEVKVRQAEKGIKADREKDKDGVKMEEGEASAGVGDASERDASGTAEGESRGQKRSASVMSASSLQNQNKRTKGGSEG